ncbi:hypothetical protein H1C71_032676, partial [Ictidomys tridecemlineatus]
MEKWTVGPAVTEGVVQVSLGSSGRLSRSRVSAGHGQGALWRWLSFLSPVAEASSGPDGCVLIRAAVCVPAPWLPSPWGAGSISIPQHRLCPWSSASRIVPIQKAALGCSPEAWWRAGVSQHTQSLIHTPQHTHTPPHTLPTHTYPNTHPNTHT